MSDSDVYSFSLLTLVKSEHRLPLISIFNAHADQAIRIELIMINMMLFLFRLLMLLLSNHAAGAALAPVIT